MFMKLKGDTVLQMKTMHGESVTVSYALLYPFTFYYLILQLCLLF